MKNRIILGITVFLLSFSNTLFGQISEDFLPILEKADSLGYEIRIQFKESSDIFIGSLQSYDREELSIENDLGSFSFAFSGIKSINVVDPDNKQTRWFANHAQDRLFLYSTAKPNDSFSGYYQNIVVMFSNLSITPIKGLTFSLFFGNFPAISFQEDAYAFRLKYSINLTHNLSVGLSGTRYGDFIFEEEFLTSFSALGTFSQDLGDYTLGLGFATDGKSVSNPIFLFGAQIRITERTVILTENWILPHGENPVIMIGPRFLGKRIATDLGFLFSPEFENSYSPYLSFSIGFGN